MSLFFYTSIAYSQTTSEFDEQLDNAYKIRTSNVENFSTALKLIKIKHDELSVEQKEYLKLLTGYEYWFQGKLNKAISEYESITQNTNNVEMHYRASLALVNVYSMNKQWQKGFDNLEIIINQFSKIENTEYRHLGLIAASIFYNELEQYQMAEIYSSRLLNDNVSGRNRCLTLNIKIKTELSSSTSLLEQEIIDAIQYCEKINELLITNVMRTYMATYYLNNNQPNQAIEILRNYYSEIYDIKYQLLIAETNSLLAQAYLKNNDLINAKKHSLLIIDNANIQAYLKAVLNAYNVLATIAEQEHDFEQAYQYRNNYIQIKEKIFEQTKAKQLAVESAKHHAVERENQILLLNKQKQIREFEITSQKQRMKIWAVGLSVLFILLLFWFYRKTTKNKMRLQQQVNQELQELDKLKDTILTNTSHELRTPLNGIIGLSDVILLKYENELEDDLIQSIRLIGNSGAKLALIVNDLLELAQLKSKRVLLNYQTFDVSILIKEVVELCLPLLKTDKVKVIFNEKDKRISIYQDLNKIQQILFNLVGNAIKFTSSGEITIHCELQSEFLWFYISDTGIGIPANKIERVFEGFEQIDNSNSKTHEGTGLGLAICRETVTLLGGKIMLRSEFGKGTIVSFCVPTSPPFEKDEI